MISQKPIKLMFLMDDFRGPKGGGTEIQFVNLLESLDPDRVHAEIVVFRQSEYSNKLYNFPFKLDTLNISKILSVKTLFELIKLTIRIKREKIKIVHIYFNDTSIIAPFFCKLGGAKVIVSRRDMGFWYTKFNLKCLFISNLFVDQIIANSNAIKLNVHEKERFPFGNITVIYNGVNAVKFVNIIKGKLRNHVGNNGNDPIIGMVANLDKIKRHKDLIEAFSLILKDFPNAKLVLAGQGPEEGNLREMSKRLGILPKTYFLGNVDEVLSVIADFDVSVLCSESEGLSNAIIEYMGCGKPVICTNTGGNPELIIDGYNGYLLDVGDVDGIVERLQLTLSNSELLKELGENAVTSFKDKFNMDTMVSSHMDIYSNLLSKNKLQIHS
jgi:glycosyltransferase involved in cell wall biosynthesis